MSTENKKFWNIAKKDDEKYTIDLFGYVGGSKQWEDGFNAQDFLTEYRSIPEDSTLDISVNSFGGEVFTALSIYTLIKEHKGAVNIRINGTAMSAATIITSAPNAKVTIPKGAMMMIHRVSSIIAGDAEDMRKTADDMEKLEENIINIYAEKTGKDVKEIRKKVNAETYFTAEEAVEFGLADYIDTETSMSNSFDNGNVCINGIQMNAEAFKNVPAWFFNADCANNHIENKEGEKEGEEMTFEECKEKFKNEIAALIEEARKEGAECERARIKAIEEIAFNDDGLANSAKFENVMSVEQYAVEVLKAENAKRRAIVNNRENDAKELEDLAGAGNTGNISGEEKAIADEAMLNEMIKDAVKGYNG